MIISKCFYAEGDHAHGYQPDQDQQPRHLPQRALDQYQDGQDNVDEGSWPDWQNPDLYFHD
jgi:hypothetical protein